MPKVGINVKLTPRSKRNEISDVMDDGTYKIRLTAPPVEGKANQSLIKYLAGILSVKADDIEIVAGQSGRSKLVMVGGIDKNTLQSRLLAEIRQNKV